MENNDKSPIIERLCKFMEYSKLSASQFADKAGIPRPSLSQMINGRNKSINNQVLAKLNAAFPNLNIVWLLFGNGTMLLDSNIEFSEPQNDDFSSIFAEDIVDNKSINTYQDTPEDFLQPDVKEDFNPGNTPKRSTTPSTSAPATQTPSAPVNQQSLQLNVSATSSAKSVKSILVLYSDGSFETFVPAQA